MTNRLASIEVRGFRSVSSLQLDLASDVTLLVGANGAGKSNLIDAFELLGYAVDQRLSRYVLANGGFSDLVHKSVTDGASDEVAIKVWSDWTNSYRNGYRLQLTQGPDDSALVRETTYTHSQNHAKPYDRVLGISTEASLADRLDDHPVNRYLMNAISGCRVFHFDDTSSDSPSLRRVDVADHDSLHSDARNLAAVLFHMKSHHELRYAQVRRSIRNVAPFFDDFVLRPDGESLLLRWREQGLDDVFSGRALSSGTLRFISLAVLLQQPSPPATIVLDEPELGLHPAAIHQLADMFRAVGPDHRIVAATQSVTLLSQFSIDEVAIVERSSDGTTVARADKEALASWLPDYSLGELWEMNLLGGRPGSGSNDDHRVRG